MAIRRYFIIHVALVYIFRETSATIHHPPLDFEYDHNIQPSTHGHRRRLPGETLGRIFGNIIVNAVKSDYNYQNSPHEDELDPDIGHDYHGQSDMEGQYGRDIYNDHYDSEEYHNDRYSTVNEIPVSRISSESSERLFEKDTPLTSGYGDRRGIIDDKANSGYQDTTLDLNGGDISRSGHAPEMNENITKNPLTPLEPEGAYKRKPSDDFHLRGINNRNFDSSDDESFKVLTVKKFMFQAQPVKPKSEKTNGSITLYYFT